MGDIAETTKVDNRQKELKTKMTCRFCLSQNAAELSNIYSRSTTHKSAPLPLQVMACVSIEVFYNDCMPGYVCNVCRLMFDYCYRFKQMCKKADTALRHYPLTGMWSPALDHPKIPVFQKNLNALQTANVTDEDPDIIPKYSLAEKSDKGVVVEDKQISPTIKEIPELMEESEEEPIQKVREVKVVKPIKPVVAAAATKPAKKILNKSAIRILNKEAQQTIEPLMSKPVLKRDDDGNIAIVTQILELDDNSNKPDPVTDAEVIETNVFPCPHCERSFPLQQLLDIHMVNHNRERSFTCEYCEKCFFSKYDLQKHNLTHTGEKPYKCIVCSKGFTRSTLLHRHEKTHIDIPKFICVYCEKPFISQEEMEKHTERHRRYRPFECKICGKTFAFKQGLERHEVVHCRIQPFQCQYCDQSFSTPSKLSRHLTAHAGERPYPCKLCPKSYLLSHHLTRHMRSHKNGTGSYKCNECDKTFGTRDTLIYHSAVHATQSMVCPLCKDAFEDIETVTDHVKQHAEGEAYACVFCDLIYMQAERLEKHIEADHADDMVAYNKDDESNTNQSKKVVTPKQSKNSNESTQQEIDEVIEEFLYEEFPENPKIEIEQKPTTIIIKDESEWEKGLDTGDAVLNENISMDESAEYLSILETSEAGDEPPAKVRKTITKPPQPRVAATSTVVRRKVPISKPVQVTSPINSDSSSPKENKKPTKQSAIKLEEISTALKPAPKTRQPTIQAALKNIPKSVSVKRVEKAPVKIETPVAISKIVKQKDQVVEKKTIQKVATTPPPAVQETKQSPILLNKRLLRQRPDLSPEKPQPKPSTSSVVMKNVPQPKVELVAVKKSTDSAAVAPIEKEKKIVEMMIGDKKVKVQRITMSKAQVAEMARDGRIQMKEGTMILKKKSIKDVKPSD